ncbi:MAG: ATP-binding protein [Candidatus Dormibacteria bacterium]
MTVAAPTVRVSLLGAPAVEIDGGRVHFDTRKVMALLALLAAHEHGISRDRVAAMLWPESDGQRSRGALRRTLSVARSALGEALGGDRTVMALDRSLAWVDTLEFEALASATDRAALERAARLYRDDFLAGFGLKDSPEFDDWQQAAAQHWRSSFAAVLERLVALAEAEDDLQGAIEWARRRVGLDLLHEPAHQLLIRVLLRAGQRGAAVRQYRECVQILGRELGVAPLPETTAAYEAALAPPGRAEGSGSSVGLPVSPAAAARIPAPSAPGGERFVGREPELAVLNERWEQVGSGGRAVAVVGEPGAGKTALVQQFARSVSDLGAAVLQIRCHEGEGSITYGVASELLAAAFAHDPDLAQRLPPQVAGEVAKIRPVVGRPKGAGDRGADRRRPTAMIRLLSSIADTLSRWTHPDGHLGPPSLVLVEDVHCADARSQELLAYLLNRLERFPLLLLLTWVADGSEGLRRLRLALASCAGSGTGTTLELPRFGVQEVRQLLAVEGAPGVDPERVLAETRGLPLLVRAYARPGDGATSDGDPPPSVTALMRGWVDGLPEPARQLVSAAAALGGTFDSELLRSVSGRGETEVEEALELAVERSLLVHPPDSEPGDLPQYDFPYAVLRRVAYTSSTATRRRIVHRRAAEALVRRHERDPSGAAPSTIARHWQLAGREPEAAAWWWRSAERARSVYANEEALERIAQAQALGFPPLKALLGTGEVLTSLGRYREALNAFQAAAAEAGGSAAEIERKIAEVYSRLGEADLAETHYSAALELIPEGDVAQCAWLGAELALVADRAGHGRRAREAARTALEQARRTADPAVQARALNSLGVLAGRHGRAQEAEALLSEALQQAGAAGSLELEVAALNNLARVLAAAGRPEDALQAANRALEVGSQLGDRHRLAALHTNLADVLHATGREQAARDHVLESARRFAVLDSSDERQPAIWELVEW